MDFRVIKVNRVRLDRRDTRALEEIRVTRVRLVPRGIRVEFLVHRAQGEIRVI